MKNTIDYFDYYVYIHTFSNGVVYIGKGRKNRAFNFNGRNCYWKRLSKKYGKPSVDFLYKNLSSSKSFKKEIAEIRKYRECGYTLCNFTDGGEGLLGFNHSKETIQKIKKTKANKPYAYSMEQRQNNSDNMKKFLALNGHPFKGKNHSSKSKQQMSKARKGKQLGCENPNYNHTKYTLIHKDFGVISLTIDEFNLEYGLNKCNVYRVLNKKRKSTKGFKLYET